MPVYMNINISIRMSINMAMIHEFEDDFYGEQLKVSVCFKYSTRFEFTRCLCLAC